MGSAASPGRAPVASTAFILSMSYNVQLRRLVSTDPGYAVLGKNPAQAFLPRSGIKEKVRADSG
jgi:hypothetical protein